MIPQQFIEEIQSRTDIVEVTSGYISLKRTGRNFKALCPFHGEKTPSLIISHQKQIFHCFGCGQGGGVFQFLMLMEKVTFPEAVEMLAKRLGLEIPYQKGNATKTKEALYEVIDKAASLFCENLSTSKGYQHILNYLIKRGIAKETIKTFRLGYAPSGNFLLRQMRKDGFTLEALEKTSLVTSADSGFRDLFRNRIIFPIFDVRSRIVGFGARISKDVADAPKYINSLENQLYSKRNHLYGLNFSKEDISKEGTAIVVEGYLDMIIPFMRGIRNIVASLGTALTFEQIRLIKRYTSQVILVYDSDKAGQAAALRSLDLLLENDLKVQVVTLPSGFDPDSLVRKKGKDYFLKAMDERKDFFDYKFDILSTLYDRESIEGKSKIAAQMLSTIDKLNSEISKYEYIRKLASKLMVREEIMIAEFRQIFSRAKGVPRYSPDSSGTGRKETSMIKRELLPIAEKVLLKFMLTSPKAFSLVRKSLKEEYFSSSLARKTVTYLFKALSMKEGCEVQRLLASVNDEEISGFTSHILMDESIPQDKDTFKDSLGKLRKKGTQETKKVLKNKIREAEIKGDGELLKELITEYGKINNETLHGPSV